MTERVIVASRAKIGLFVALSLVFVAIGVWMVQSNESPKTLIFGWAAIGFFGVVGIPALALQLIKPPRLILGPEALVMEQTFGKTTRLAWADIDEFVLWSFRRSSQVAFRYKEGRRPNTLAQNLIGGMGIDGALGTAWPIRPEALCQLLNEAKNAARA